MCLTSKEYAYCILECIQHQKANEKGLHFQNICVDVLRLIGESSVKKTSNGGDYGIDIIAHNVEGMYLYQCKCYETNKKIGIQALQQLISGQVYYNLLKGKSKLYLIGNTTFTDEAENLAYRAGNVQLINREKLLKWMQNACETYFNIQSEPYKVYQGTNISEWEIVRLAFPTITEYITKVKWLKKKRVD